ncbi:hypothetical protein EGR_11102 [Echinococcus granulosus]|uniref:Uncharacterized protein n=1 Tax=Echinococcus granulosus TaxID=6210 RepID=W6UKM1_ECHGR|nr:hypothetical protein EGR_11102 [Echinococcus granulosus]EUB54039.1 hypothetical protein EGR_11102 [Echinococcus granulosus]
MLGNGNAWLSENFRNYENLECLLITGRVFADIGGLRVERFVSLDCAMQHLLASHICRCVKRSGKMKAASAEVEGKALVLRL